MSKINKGKFMRTSGYDYDISDITKSFHKFLKIDSKQEIIFYREKYHQKRRNIVFSLPHF